MSSRLSDSDWAAYDLPLDGQDGEASSSPPSRQQPDALVIERNLSWFCSLRWLAIAGLAVLALLGWVSSTIVTIPGLHLDPVWFLAVAGVLSLLNVAWIVLARGASRGAPDDGHRLAGRTAAAQRILWLQILLDLAVLTVVVHVLGSLATFAPFMYLFHIVLACIFLPYTKSLAVTLAAMGMYLACLVLEASGAVRPSSLLSAGVLPDRGVAPLTVTAVQFLSVAFVSFTVWYLASRLSNSLRRREEELVAINRRLEAATEERATHMLQTTHQLKAPFAAIHANAQILLGGHCGPLPPAALSVVEQIATRCETLSRGITAMLQLANLRSQAQDPPPLVPVDVSGTVRSCLAVVKPQALKRGIHFEENLLPATVMAVQDHAVMIIDNILSNAVAYSMDGQRIWVSSRPGADGGAVVVVRDCGIGIPPDKLPRIFEDYYRTTEAARHNHGSTGLGLAIVRQTALAGSIHVHVESAPLRGTVFTLDFPSTAGEARSWRTF